MQDWLGLVLRSPVALGTTCEPSALLWTIGELLYDGFGFDVSTATDADP
jgi:hypothetical protein